MTGLQLYKEIIKPARKALGLSDVALFDYIKTLSILFYIPVNQVHHFTISNNKIDNIVRLYGIPDHLIYDADFLMNNFNGVTNGK